MLLKSIFGALAILVGLIGYIPYLRDVFITKTTKPHFFSWLLWAVLETIGFAAAATKGAGAGAWVLGFSALVVYVVAIKAFLDRRDLTITKLDWFGFIGAICAIILWLLTKKPTYAVIIVSIADAMAFIPTYRKTFYRPNEETLAEYFSSFLKHILGIMALRSYNLATWLYLASLAFTNGAFLVMVWWRRRNLI